MNYNHLFFNFFENIMDPTEQESCRGSRVHNSQ